MRIAGIYRQLWYMLEVAKTAAEKLLAGSVRSTMPPAYRRMFCPRARRHNQEGIRPVFAHDEAERRHTTPACRESSCLSS